jgi:hypothetical protein
MLSSSAITIAANSERLTCDGFSLNKNVCLGNFEFIADYFSGLSLSPRRGDVGIAFMGSTHRGAPTPRWAMIEDSGEEVLTASRGEGSFDLPSPKRHSAGASLTPATTTPWMENASATQATTTVPPRKATPWSETSLPFERCHTHHARQQAQACTRQPIVEQEAAPRRSKITGKQATTVV